MIIRISYGCKGYMVIRIIMVTSAIGARVVIQAICVVRVIRVLVSY
jgi:hypothetical protein